MEPVFPIEDSEDEACSYLLSVRKQAESFESKVAKSIQKLEPGDWFMPKSEFKPGFKIDLTRARIDEILKRFVATRQQVLSARKPVEKTRTNSLIRQILYTQRPYLNIIFELDDLGVNKVLKFISKSLEDYSKLEEWIYCLLCLLDPPFELEIYSVLNQIMQAAIKHHPSPSATLIILIISEFFGQKLP